MAVRGVTFLQEEISKARTSLQDVDENIKKLTGRDPVFFRGRGRGFGVAGRGRGRVFEAARRGISGNREEERHGPPPAKRRGIVGSAFGRLGPQRRRRDSGDDEELPHKPALSSAVTAAPVEDTAAAKAEVLETQKTDEKGQARNRRMFGMLLGTLQKFKKDTTTRSDKQKQRDAIEEKVEEKFIEEKNELRREKSQLFFERKQTQFRIRRMEQKMELVQIHEEWEAQTKNLMNFIRTKAKPPIYYRPKKSHPGSDKKLRETRDLLQEVLKDRRTQLEEEIDELMKSKPTPSKRDLARGKSDLEGRRRRGEDEDEEDEDDDEDDEREEPVGEEKVGMEEEGANGEGADEGKGESMDTSDNKGEADDPDRSKHDTDVTEEESKINPEMS